MRNRLKERYGQLSSLLNLEIKCSYSRMYLKWVVIAHIIASIYVCMSALSPVWMAFVLTGLTGHLIYSIQDILKTRLPTLYVADSVWKIEKSNAAFDISSVNLLFQCPWFLVFRFELGRKSYLRFICFDQVSPAIYHRLSVLLNST